MNEALALALVSSIEEEMESVQALRGKRGLRGPQGVPFLFEDHKEDIYSFLIEYLKDDSSFLESVRGQDGLGGMDGKDFVFDEHQDEIKNIIHSLRDALKLQFSDLTEEEKCNLRLKFSGLTVNEKEELKGPRGPRGQRGRPGQDFVFDEHREYFDSLKLKFSDLTEEELDNLKLKFDNLSEDEKGKLKLKFSDLTDDERDTLKGDRGPRGQRGRQGADGLAGKDVTVEDVRIVVDENEDKLRGPRGVPGVAGVVGPKGLIGSIGPMGEAGQDAPEIEEIELLTRGGDEIAFRFEFDDGSSIDTDYVKLPELKQRNNIYVAGGVRGGGSRRLVVNLLDSDYTIPVCEGYFEQTVSGLTTYLPAVPVDGCDFFVTNFSNGNGTVDGNGNTILGDATKTIKKKESFRMLFNGLEWKII